MELYWIAFHCFALRVLVEPARNARWTRMGIGWNNLVLFCQAKAINHRRVFEYTSTSYDLPLSSTQTFVWAMALTCQWVPDGWGMLGLLWEVCWDYSGRHAGTILLHYSIGFIVPGNQSESNIWNVFKTIYWSVSAQTTHALILYTAKIALGSQVMLSG